MKKIRRISEQSYYSHPMFIYGTEQEARHLKFLKGLKKKVLNPATDMIVPPGSNMEPFLKVVEQCKEVIIGSFYTKHISKGTFDESRHALKCGVKVYHIWGENGDLSLREVAEVRISDPNDWKRKYGVIIHKENGHEQLLAKQP